MFFFFSSNTAHSSPRIVIILFTVPLLASFLRAARHKSYRLCLKLFHLASFALLRRSCTKHTRLIPSGSQFSSLLLPFGSDTFMSDCVATSGRLRDGKAARRGHLSVKSPQLSTHRAAREAPLQRSLVHSILYGTRWNISEICSVYRAKCLKHFRFAMRETWAALWVRSNQGHVWGHQEASPWSMANQVDLFTLPDGQEANVS